MKQIKVVKQLTPTVWTEKKNVLLANKGFRLWRNDRTFLWILTSIDSKSPPGDNATGGFYNVIDLLKAKGI